MNDQQGPADQGPEKTVSTPRLHDNPPVRGHDGEPADEDARHGWHDADGTPYQGDREQADAASTAAERGDEGAAAPAPGRARTEREEDR
ncbi:hypothetical protein [Kitasatospora phosalacinea]|uniref:hypothetical protein n=1 Tax=Kitasatospora phosalacinea TaxID=2065 RepID=UPI000525DD50|nr:hypothetical protein [Kitasatospora phosalacinea]